MKKNSKIYFGSQIINPGDVIITNIYVDRFSHMVTFISEKSNLSVKSIIISVEECEAQGIINLEKLRPWVK